MNAYHYVGTYSDGVTRRGVVHTDNLAGWIGRMTTGLLPFQRIDTMPCANPFNCDH